MRHNEVSAPTEKDRLVEFQRYLTRTFPVTSAMSYEIGIYVLENLVERGHPKPMGSHRTHH